MKTVIGHSLGGSTALELRKNYKHITSSRTHGAPVWNPLGSESNEVDRYRNWLDPVSMFDRSAVKFVKWNPCEPRLHPRLFEYRKRFYILRASTNIR